MGSLLKKLRTERHERDPQWTQEYVARKVGTTKANISKLESKPKTRVDLSVFFGLADLYGIDPRELATGAKPAKRTDGEPTLSPKVLSAARALEKLHPDITLQLTMLIHTLQTVGSENYYAWGRDIAAKRAKTAAKPTPAAQNSK